jgi:hypothetical protein
LWASRPGFPMRPRGDCDESVPSRRRFDGSHVVNWLRVLGRPTTRSVALRRWESGGPRSSPSGY